MTDTDARAWTALVLIALGGLLYLFSSLWVPTTVIVGPLRMGDGTDCHGLASGDGTPYAALCR